MTHKLRSKMFSQKIDTSADIIFESLTLLEGFVILDLKSSERLINSSERLILCRWNDLLCGNANLSHSPTGTGCPRPHQACNYSTPVHLAISTSESLGHISCDALATALEPHRDLGWMHPPSPLKKEEKKREKKKIYFVVESF